MNSNDFCKYGKEVIDFIVNYTCSLEDRRVLPDIKPGYLKSLIPNEAPVAPEKWENVFSDIEKIIMPGVTHWNSPNFHAYFPTANSYAAILGDLISNAINPIGFSWISCPACTELEIIMLDWTAKALGLPEFYLSENYTGGGVIQNSVSESSFLAVLSAKNKKLNELYNDKKECCKDEMKSKLVAYISCEGHSSIERAVLLNEVILRKIKTDKEFSIDSNELENAILNDIENGLIPFFLGATHGTTGLCAFDNLVAVGPICEKYGLWVHVDAAYAGAALLCPEFRFLMNGLEYSHSYVFNPNKWMRVNFDIATFWIKEKKYLIEQYCLNPTYLNNPYMNEAPDLRHWTISFGRKFRSLKLWFVFRLYGIEGIQDFLRKHVNLAKHFKKLLENDNDFELIGQSTLGLICFRFKNSNKYTEDLLRRINSEGLIFMISSKIDDLVYIRFVVCSELTEERHIDFAYNVIRRHANDCSRLEIGV